MPKTLLEKIVFTVVMAAIMVYGMIVYNVALATGGVTNATFGMALHEMPIMVPVAFVLEFFVVEKLATALAFTFMRPTDRPQFITYALWQRCCSRSPASVRGCIRSAAISRWLCAGRCSTAARCPASSSVLSSAAVDRTTSEPISYIINR